MAIIYLSRRLPDGIDLPTLDRFAEANRASSPQRSYTWHFSMQGLPPAGVTTDSRELLPHVFTIASQRLVVIFCGTFCSPLARRPGCSPVHCSVLSGLSYPS